MELTWYEKEVAERYKIKTVILWLVYLLYVLILTLKPFDFSSGYFFQFFKFKHGFIHAFLGSFKFWDIFLNILFFIPMGFLTTLMLRQDKNPNNEIIKRSVAICFIASGLAEFSQLFLVRTSSLTDLFTNTLGGYLGTLWAHHISFAEDRFPGMFIVNHENKLTRIISYIYIGLVVIVFSLPLWLNGFYNWNDEFKLMLGNEASLDRQWQGTFYEVAIYNRMLTQDEVLQCYYHHRTSQSNENLIALYEFREGRGPLVFDRSNSVSDLNLGIQDLEKVKWLQPEGLFLDQGAFLQSLESAEMLNRRLRKTHELSIELRFKPANLTQTGPARIITMSQNVDERNFMVGQAKDRLNFRVRTPLTGKNGSNIDLYTQQPVLNENIHHVVAVFNRGAEQFYVDGKLVDDSIRGISNYIPFLLGFGRGTFGKICFCFLLLFPLGWLSQVTAGWNQWTLVRGLLCTILPVILLQGIFYVIFNQPFDAPIIGITIFTAFLVLFLSHFPFYSYLED